MNNRAQKSDHTLAKKLAEVHEKMLDSRSMDQPAVADELQAEREVLDFIERVKRAEISAGNEEIATNPAAPLETQIDGALAEDPTLDRSLPERIGRFQILELLGQGGYGIVYRAFDPELDREVAIKIPRAEALLTPDLRKRFIREAKIAASLSHPNIVTIFESGQHESICFLVSELIEGITLADWIADQNDPIDQRQTAKLVAALSDALQHAHSRNVLHRDLKPANILLPAGDALASAHSIPASARIADFGLARVEGDVEYQTQTGAMVGTPVYMSPEQMRDSSNATTFAADIYSLGCILYELIAGKRPFDGRGVLEVIQAVQTTNAKTLRSLRSDTSPDLEAICFKCLEKDPESRYDSAHSLKQDLENFLENKPVSARRIGQVGRLARWAKRNPALSTMTGVLATALIVGLVTVSLLLWRTNNLLTETEAMRGRAVDSARELQYAVDEMLTALVAMPEIESAGFEPVRANLLARVNGYYEKFSDAQLDDPELRNTYSQTLFTMANIRSRLGDRTGSIESAEEALRLHKSSDENSYSERQFRIDVLLFLAKQIGQDRKVESNEHVSRALVMARSPAALSDDSANLDLAITLTEVADYFSKQGEITLSRQYVDEAMQVWETVDLDLITDQAAVLAYGRVLNSAAINNARSENKDDMLRYSQMAVDFFEARVANVDHTDDELFALARALHVNGFALGHDRSQANVVLKRGVEILTELSIRHPAVFKYPLTYMATQYNIGLNLYLEKEYEGADEVLKANIDFGDELLIRFPEEEKTILGRLSDNLTMLGIVQGYLGQRDDQLQTYYQSKSVLTRRYDNPEENNEAIVAIAGVDGEIGKCLTLLNRHDEAADILQETIERLQSVLIRDPENGQARRFMSNSYMGLAKIHADGNRYEQAISAMRQRVEHDLNNGPFAENHHIAGWQLRLGKLEQALQSTTEFRQYCLDQNRPFTFAELTDELLSSCDELVDSGAINSDGASPFCEEVTQMAIGMLENSLVEPLTRDDNLTRIDESETLARLRQTDQFQLWRAGQ